MQDALVTLSIVVVAVGIVIAIYTLLTSGGSLREIGARGLETGDGAPPGGAAPDERDQEIEQMLGARNRRRELRGEPPLDAVRSSPRCRARSTTTACARRSVPSSTRATAAAYAPGYSRWTSSRRSTASCAS